MATHSSVLAWRIPGTGEPGGLPSIGLHRVGHDWSDLAAAAARNRSWGCKVENRALSPPLPHHHPRPPDCLKLILISREMFYSNTETVKGLVSGSGVHALGHRGSGRDGFTYLWLFLVIMVTWELYGGGDGNLDLHCENCVLCRGRGDVEYNCLYFFKVNLQGNWSKMITLYGQNRAY